MSEDKYIRYQDEKQRDYEDLCKRCGTCCGVFDKDPCINLIPSPEFHGHGPWVNSGAGRRPKRDVVNLGPTGFTRGAPEEELKGKYFCAIYENRFGMQRSISGREFICVPIRDILHKSWSGSFNCAYKKTILNWAYR